MRCHVPLLALLLALSLLTACGDDVPQSDPAPRDVSTQPSPSEEPTGPVVDYPHEGTLFPPDFVPPTFLWHDDTEGVTRWRIEVHFAEGEPLRRESTGPPPPDGEIDRRAIGPTNEIYEGTPYQRSARSWTPDAGTWAEIQQRCVESPARLTFHGTGAGDPDGSLSEATVSFRTSTDPVGAPIFYRDVPLMPGRGEAGVIRPLAKGAVPLIAWRLRDVTRADSKVVLQDMPTCANCHSFSRDGKTLGMDVDGPQGDKGAYALAPVKKNMVIGDAEVITWNDFADKPKGHKTIGFLSRISPDGQHALTTLNEAVYVANFEDFRFLQVFFPTRGILAWYSKATDEMKALPGADDTEFVHCDPAWTPDGKTIVFARATAFDPYEPGKPLATHAGDPNEPRIQYDLYRMPFNEGRGGTPTPIEGASANGMSNTFPKVSPDGKWVVFTQCANGQLMRPDGRLWIVPLEGGEAREMRCNTSLMNSWHSFSPNGRWMVFSSKVNGPYTQMHLTHIDEDGNDTPPVLIPNSTAANRAVNLPEFFNAPYESLDTIDVPAVDHHRLMSRGSELVKQGRFAEAIPVLEEAVEKEPDFSRALGALGLALLQEERMQEAKERLLRSLDIDPNSSTSHNLLGLAYHREGRNEDALRELRLAIQHDFLNGEAYHNQALALLALERHEEALKSLERAAELLPTSAEVLSDFGFLLRQAGQGDRGVGVLRRAVEADPKHLRARKNLAFALVQSSDLEGARKQYLAAQKIEPRDAGVLQSLALIEARLGNDAECVRWLGRLLEVAPDDARAHRSMAWYLATSPEDRVRDGVRALRHAERAISLGGSDDPGALDVLAAAYAESGRLDMAVKTARRALAAVQAGAGETAPGLEARLADYEAGRPHRRPRGSQR